MRRPHRGRAVGSQCADRVHIRGREEPVFAKAHQHRGLTHSEAPHGDAVRVAPRERVRGGLRVRHAMGRSNARTLLPRARPVFQARCGEWQVRRGHRVGDGALDPMAGHSVVERRDRQHRQ